MEPSRWSRETQDRTLVAIVAVIGLIWGFYVTRAGLKVRSDSATYLGVADQIRAGGGFRLAFDEPGRWLDAFPPGLSIALAARTSALSPMDWARLLTVALLAINASLIAGITVRHAPRWRFAGLLTGVIFLVSSAVLKMHTEVLSEPLYLAFALLTVDLLLRRASSTRPQLLLIAAGVGAGLATLTRFVGVATVGSCAVWLLLTGAQRPARRVVSAAVFIVASSIPFGAWTLFSASRNESVNRRGAAYHAPGFRHIEVAAESLREWLIPPGTGDVLGSAAAVVVLVGVGWLLWRAFLSLYRPADGGGVALLVGLGLGHVAVTVFVIYFVAEGNFLNSRTLLPVYAALLPAFVIALSTSVASRGATRLAVAVAVGVLVVNAANAIPQAVRRDSEDRFWAAPSWRVNAGIELVDGLPPDAVVYSDYPDLVWFTTGRAARGLPAAQPSTGGTTRPDRIAIETMVRAMEAKAGAVITFDQPTADRRSDDATRAAIFDELDRDVTEFDGGRIVVVDER